MPDPQLRRAELRAFTLALGWMLVVQLACVALWDAGILTRVAALLHWLVVGVLAPAMALFTCRPAPRADGAGG